MGKPRGLFDKQYWLEKLSKQKDPLGKLSSYVDFEYFRKPLKQFFDKASDSRKGGRPPYDYLSCVRKFRAQLSLVFKILILQRYYNLNVDNIEYAVLDRLSFMRFLGLGINDPVPDAKTIWLFRDKVTQGSMVEKLFKDLDKLQYRSFKRIAAGIGLMNFTCNILRLVQLNVVLSK